jgi:hypothetical protein
LATQAALQGKNHGQGFLFAVGVLAKTLRKVVCLRKKTPFSGSKWMYLNIFRHVEASLMGFPVSLPSLSATDSDQSFSHN